MRIGIVGAGIGGLAAAALLAGDGHAVRVFDAFDAPAPVGSGLVVQPVGLAALAAAGADRAALARGTRIHRMLGVEARTGARILDVRYGPEGGDRFGLAIHRASLFDAVLAAARRRGAAVVSAAPVAESVLDADRRIIVLQSGRRAGPFDLVVDAAGARSPLSPLMGTLLPYGALWATVPWPAKTALPVDRLSQRYRRASKMAGVLPVGTMPGQDRDMAAVFWSLPESGEAAWRATPLDAWKAEAAALWPEVAPFLDPIRDQSQMTMARYTHGRLRRPYGTRLVHIGDAAHRASPQLGQGANMALLDAWALARALRRYPVERALPAYAQARAAHVWAYQAMSALFTPQYQSDSRALPVLRDWALAPLSRMPPLPWVLGRLVSGDLLPPIRRL